MLMQNKDSSKEAAEVLGETSSQSDIKRMGPGPVFSSLVMNEDGGEGERYYYSLMTLFWMARRAGRICGRTSSVICLLQCVVCKPSI